MEATCGTRSKREVLSLSEDPICLFYLPLNGILAVLDLTRFVDQQWR